MVTSKEVAELANVSISTVSRAFRDDVYISEDKKRRVLEAAKQLGYTPNLLARSLKNNKSSVIGLMLSDIDNVFYSIVSRIIESDLKNHGYRLLITYNNENPLQESQNLDLLSASRAEGIIFTPNSSKNQNIIDRLQKQNISLVQMFRVGYPKIDSVLVDDVKGAYMATKHLLQNGHTNILLLSVDYSLNMTDEEGKQFKDPRTQGFTKAMEEENIPVEDSNIVLLPYHTDLRHMIMRKIKEINPTAIIAGTNIIAKDVIKSCKELKLSIPNDISLVMFDDVDFASLLDITTVSQPIEEIGHAACRSIINKLNETNSSTIPMKTILEPMLISRNSVKNLYQHPNHQ